MIHFIGIGGVGISALARMFLAEGKKVSGSDRGESPITRELAAAGAKIYYGHDAGNLAPEVELVVYTIAITPDNPELLEAQKRGVTVLSYPQMLGRISAEKFTIAISGTHGKTTTTAMLAKICLDAGLDPTVIVGSLMNGLKTNFIAGQSRYLIVEACEYRRSFLNLKPRILVVTNIDNDHLDYYHDLDDIKSAFAELAAKVPADGQVITEQEYAQVARPIELKLPGEHNQRNAQAAIAAALALGVGEKAARRSLAAFAGTWRRFEYKGELPGGASLYDDYAHHPTEVAATLRGAREAFPDRRLVLIFQPHLYSRTKLLFDDFVASLGLADEVVLLPIYAARELLDPTISAEVLAAALRVKGVSARAVLDFSDATAAVRGLEPDAQTVVVTMGAGNVFELAEALLQSGNE